MFSKVEKVVIDYYLKSGDFNGISVANHINATGSEFTEISNCISEAVRCNKLRIISSDYEMNPHIIREGFREKEVQLEALKPSNINHTCVYPSKELLEENVLSDLHQGSPFTRKLAMGVGQLEIAFFDLDLLELYGNDPRFFYECNDIGGRSEKYGPFKALTIASIGAGFPVDAPNNPLRGRWGGANKLKAIGNKRQLRHFNMPCLGK